MYYYVPLVGLSVGAKRLDIPPSVFGFDEAGQGGAYVDTGSTTSFLAVAAYEPLLAPVKLPVSNRTVPDYDLCFALPPGVPVAAMRVPELAYHFDGGARMALPPDNYFQEPIPRLMCLSPGNAEDAGVPGSVIGNVQMQNLHVLFDEQNQQWSFAPTQCDKL